MYPFSVISFMYGLAQAKSFVFMSLNFLLKATASAVFSCPLFGAPVVVTGVAVISVSSVGTSVGAAIAGTETDNAITRASVNFINLLFI